MSATPDYRSWVGNRETAEDVVTAAAVAGMSATLDRDDPPPGPGDPLPPLWHWMLFAPRARASTLGPDGHPARGGFLPPVALPRRMFAGARCRFHRPLRVGEAVRREARVLDVTPKEGRSGPLVFVRVGHAIEGADGLAIEEENDIVYRGHGEGGGGAAEAFAPSDAPWSRTVTPDPVLLFRYSALTFNGHRIHYDHPYATGEEGYPGLVVHGPLIATLLADLCREGSGDRPLATFRFRARRPIFDTRPFFLEGGPRRDEDGSEGFWANALGGDRALAMETGGTFAD